jgi:hypothetical protein
MFGPPLALLHAVAMLRRIEQQAPAQFWKTTPALWAWQPLV